jgi:hypothetical protein
MSGFTKLDAGIVDSSIWSEDSDTRIVWITLLARADQHGVANIVPSALARCANVSLASCLNALEKFQQPDPESRTTDNEGRRVAKIDAGWLILNHGIYRAKEYSKDMSQDPKAVANRDRVKRFRDKLKALQDGITSVTPSLQTITGALPYVYASASVSDLRYERPPAAPKPLPDPEPIATKAVMAEGARWATELIASYGETPAQAGQSVWNTTLANCCELVGLGKPRDKFDLLCDWIQNSKNSYKPKSPQSASDPTKWSAWQTSMQDEIERAKTKKGREL